MAKKSALEWVNTIDEFKEVNEFMNDKDLEEALAAVIKLIVQPTVPQTEVIPLMLQLQAIAAKLSVQASIYTTIKKGSAGSSNAHKKNVYYSAAEAINRLVDTLKYSARYTVV